MRHAIRFLIPAFILAVLPLYAQAQSATITNLYNLNASVDGSTPYGSLVQGPDGNFYGTTAKDGASGNGTIYRLTPKGVYTVLYTFQGSPDGQNPQNNLYFASDGNLYGTTARGGANGAGTIFRISPAGVFTLLYTFTGGTDGNFPQSSLIEGSDGNFYGTTVYGGAVNAAGFEGYGTIYQMTPNGVLSTLYTFSGGDDDGASPYAGLVEGSDGLLYGTTNNNEVGDSQYEQGSAFKIGKDGVYTNLHHFGGGNDGSYPDGGLVEGPDGSFYGSTHDGGLYADDDDDTGQGVVYNITPDGTFKTVYEFTGQADSGRPEGTLTFASDGNLYGTTTVSPSGTLFQLTPAGGFVTLNLLSSTSNEESLGGPIVGSDGYFYGTTDNGGPSFNGSIFQAIPSPSLKPLVQLTLSAQTVPVGTPVTLNWQVAQAYSNTAQRCAAFVQNGATGGGPWTGLQTGTFSGSIYSGSAQITPTAAGTYTYALNCGGTISGFATLTVPAMQATTTTLPDATVGVAYSQTLGEQNGLAPFTWTIASGSLPTGLALNSTTGAITGTPTTAGINSFTVEVTDAESSPASASTSLSITVGASAPTVTVSATTLKVSAPGATVSTTLSVSGFAGNVYSFSCSGLPAKAQCLFGTVSGSPSYGATTLQIITDGGLSAQSKPATAHTAPEAGALAAAAIPGMLALFGFARRRKRAALNWLVMAIFTATLAGGLLTGCGGSSKRTTTTTTTTPTGTSTVTVTATAGDQSATTSFTLEVQ